MMSTRLTSCRRSSAPVLAVTERLVPSPAQWMPCLQAKIFKMKLLLLHQLCLSMLLFSVLARRAVLDPNAMRPHDGLTALHLAALHGSCEVVAALISSGADVNAVAIAGETPLSCAQDALREGFGGAYEQVRCLATIASLKAAGDPLRLGCHRCWSTNCSMSRFRSWSGWIVRLQTKWVPLG